MSIFLNNKFIILAVLSVFVFSGCSFRNSKVKQMNDGSVKDGVFVNVSDWPTYENTDFGYKIKYPLHYVSRSLNGEGNKYGVGFIYQETEDYSSQTEITIGDQNYMLYLTEGDRGDVMVFDFAKEGIIDIYDLKEKKTFPKLVGNIEKINDLEFLKLSGEDRFFYIVQNPKNLKFLVFET